MYDFFVEKVYKVIILNAPIKTVFIRNDKPKTLKTDDQIRKLFNAETNEANKWKIINNTRNSPKIATEITCLKNSFNEPIVENKKWQTY